MTAPANAIASSLESDCNRIQSAYEASDPNLPPRVKYILRTVLLRPEVEILNFTPEIAAELGTTDTLSSLAMMPVPYYVKYPAAANGFNAQATHAANSSQSQRLKGHPVILVADFMPTMQQHPLCALVHEISHIYLYTIASQNVDRLSTIWPRTALWKEQDRYYLDGHFSDLINERFANEMEKEFCFYSVGKHISHLPRKWAGQVSDFDYAIAMMVTRNYKVPTQPLLGYLFEPIEQVFKPVRVSPENLDRCESETAAR